MWCCMSACECNDDDDECFGRYNESHNENENNNNKHAVRSARKSPAYIEREID